MGRNRGDDVVFTEADGHSALLATHDGPEYADASAFWIPECFTGVIGQKQLQAYFRAFRQEGVRVKEGAAGADVCRPESEFSLFGGSRQRLDFHRDREIVALVFRLSTIRVHFRCLVCKQSIAWGVKIKPEKSMILSKKIS